MKRKSFRFLIRFCFIIFLMGSLTLQSSAAGIGRYLNFGGPAQGEAIINMGDCFLAPGTVYTESVNLINKSSRGSKVQKIQLIEKEFAHQRGVTIDDNMKDLLRSSVSIRFYDDKHNNYYEGTLKELVGKEKELTPPITLAVNGHDGSQKNIKIDVSLNENATSEIEGITYKFDFKIRYEEWTYKEDDPIYYSDSNTRPVITVIDDQVMTIETGTDFKDPGATADDKEDGDITHKIKTTVNGEPGDQIDTTKPGKFEIEYNVKDSKGLAAYPKIRTVVVVDPLYSKPVIHLIDKAYLEVEQYTEFVDPGAVAYDKIDGDITEKIVDKINKGQESIDTTVLGMNAITYNVTNSLGVAADEVIRVVKVVPVTVIEPPDDSTTQDVIIDTGQRMPFLQYGIGLGVILIGITMFKKKEQSRG